MTLGDSGRHERCPVLCSRECEVSVGPRRRLGTGHTASGRRRRSRPPGRLVSSPPTGQTRTVKPHRVLLNELQNEGGCVSPDVLPAWFRPDTDPPPPPHCRAASQPSQTAGRDTNMRVKASPSAAPSQQHTPTFRASWTIFRFPGPRHSSV